MATDCQYYDECCKDVAATLMYWIDWANLLSEGEEIISSNWEFDDSPEGIVIEETSGGDPNVPELETQRWAMVSGGVDGTSYRLCNTITTSLGQTVRQCILLQCYEEIGLTPFTTQFGYASGFGIHEGDAAGQTDEVAQAYGTGEHAGSATPFLTWFGTATGRGWHTGQANGQIIPSDPGLPGGAFGTAAHFGSATGVINRIFASAGGTAKHDGFAQGTLSANGLAGGTGTHIGSAIGFVNRVFGTASAKGWHTGTVQPTVINPPPPPISNVASGVGLHVGSAFAGLSEFGTASGLAVHTGSATGTWAVPPEPEPPTDLWMGIGQDANRRTLFDETGYNVSLVTSQSEFVSAIAGMDAGTVDKIRMRAGPIYTWPSGKPLRRIDRRNNKSLPQGDAGSRERPCIIEWETPGQRPRIDNMISVDCWSSPLGGLPFFGFVLRGIDFDYFRLLSWGNADILVEDCIGRVQSDAGRDTNFTWKMDPAFAAFNFCIRWSILLPNPSYAGQGFYTINTQNKMEYNTFDNNGRAIGAPIGSDREHNVYINRQYVENCRTPSLSVPGSDTFRYNVTGESSNYGCHFRSGGDVYGNLILRNPVGLGYGYNFDGKCVIGPTRGTVHHNLWLQGRQGNTANGVGLWIADIMDSDIYENVLLHQDQPASGAHCFIRTKTGCMETYGPDIILRDNTTHQWGKGIYHLAARPWNVTESNNQWELPNPPGDTRAVVNNYGYDAVMTSGVNLRANGIPSHNWIVAAINAGRTAVGKSTWVP